MKKETKLEKYNRFKEDVKVTKEALRALAKFALEIDLDTEALDLLKAYSFLNRGY